MSKEIDIMKPKYNRLKERSQSYLARKQSCSQDLEKFKILEEFFEQQIPDINKNIENNMESLQNECDKYDIKDKELEISEDENESDYESENESQSNDNKESQQLEDEQQQQNKNQLQGSSNLEQSQNQNQRSQQAIQFHKLHENQEDIQSVNQDNLLYSDQKIDEGELQQQSNKEVQIIEKQQTIDIGNEGYKSNRSNDSLHDQLEQINLKVTKRKKDRVDPSHVYNSDEQEVQNIMKDILKQNILKDELFLEYDQLSPENKKSIDDDMQLVKFLQQKQEKWEQQNEKLKLLKIKKIQESLDYSKKIREQDQDNMKITNCINCKQEFSLFANDENSCQYHIGQLRFYSCHKCGGDEYYSCCNVCSKCDKGCMTKKHQHVLQE